MAEKDLVNVVRLVDLDNESGLGLSCRWLELMHAQIEESATLSLSLCPFNRTVFCDSRLCLGPQDVVVSTTTSANEMQKLWCRGLLRPWLAAITLRLWSL
eukprot:1651094-Amphidinium_carterae.1